MRGEQEGIGHRNKILTGVFLALLAVFFVLFVRILSEIGLEGITGRAVTSVNVTNVTFLNCTYTVPEGMSFFSAYCMGTEEAVQDLFGNSSVVGAVFYYEPSTENDQWRSYNPSLPGWAVQDLSMMSRRKGYVLFMNGVTFFCCA